MIGVDPYHQGIMFKPAFDVAHGQMLFRDTFTGYGALSTLLQAWALRIFGDYLMVIQIETAFFYGLISVCLWYLWKCILPQWLTTTSVVIWLLLAPYFISIFLPWSSVYALFFQLFSLLLLLRAVREQNRLMIMLAGGVAVLAFWCRQPVGVFHCASLVFFLATAPLITGQQWKYSMTDCAFFIAGIVVASVPFFAWLALNGAIHDMYLQSIKAAFFFGVKLKMPFIEPGSHNLFVKILMTLYGYYNGQSVRLPGTSFIWSLLPLVCLSLLAILAVKVYRNRNSMNNQLPFYGILLVSLASWLQYYPLPCIRHSYWAATPMIGVFSYGAWKLFKPMQQKNMQALMVYLILAFVFGVDIEHRISSGLIKINTLNTRIEEPKVLRGMYESPPAAEEYKVISMSLNNAIERDFSHYLVDLSLDALYLTFIGPQNNFHPMYIYLLNDQTEFIYPEYLKHTIEFIKTKKPLILTHEGISIPGANCVSIFNVTDFLSQNRLALYSFFLK